MTNDQVILELQRVAKREYDKWGQNPITTIINIAVTRLKTLASPKSKTKHPKANKEAE